jgi:hypothetical protein
VKTIQSLATATLVASAVFAGAASASDTDNIATVATVADAEVSDEDVLKALKQSIRRVEWLPESEAMYWRTRRHGLNMVNVLWEDTGRDAGSSLGPNISDVTLQLRAPINGNGPRFRTHDLPVLRHPNFSDKTADIAADQLWVKVGNQSRGAQLVSVPLSEVLANLREYVSNPESIRGSGDLSAPRDTHMLVSAQHVFVPIPSRGKIEFTPVIYNYQSGPGVPAVLTLLVTRQGTSVVAVTNSGPDATDVGQRLYFNNKGQKTTLSAERHSDVKARVDAAVADNVALAEQDVGALDDGADMMMIVQVPLRVPRARVHTYGPPPMPMSMAPSALADSMGSSSLAPAKKSMSQETPASAGRRAESDVEQAVLGHGEDLGEIAEGRNLRLVRDPRFPVRVTVQFYKATSNGVISDADLVAAKADIDKVYAKGDFVGSLVVPEGARHRPTDWHLGHTQPVAIIHKTLTLPPPPVSLVDAADVAENGDAPPDVGVIGRFMHWLVG